jgi:sterol desaturase/sphingolipid hydroxylase (fatty acid hydroxylase superfamily)
MTVVLAAVLGVLTWTLLEYLIHRFLGHEPKTRPNPFATEHVRHHSEGDYFAPAWKKALAALAFLAVLLPPALWIAGAAHGGAYVAGLIGFYVTYEVLHRREHTHAGFTAYGRWARRHHFAHHYADTRFNHGVTTPLWDIVFGTWRPVETVRVPSRFLMPWLKDPATGAVKPEFSDTFYVA